MDYSDGPDYRVVFVRSALEAIRDLDKSSYVQIRDVINSLAYTPRPQTASKVGRSRWHMRIPAGDYDIFYDIDPDALFVIVTKLVHH